MKKTLFFIVPLVLTLGACAHYVDLVKEKKASVEIIPPKEMVKIRYVHVYKKEAGFEVTGQFERTGLGIMNGHMDIAVTSSDNKLLEAKSTYIPKINTVSFRRRPWTPVYFYANFDRDLPFGSKVFVAFHPEKITDRVDCGNNQALLGISARR